MDCKDHNVFPKAKVFSHSGLLQTKDIVNEASLDTTNRNSSQSTDTNNKDKHCQKYLNSTTEWKTPQSESEPSSEALNKQMCYYTTKEKPEDFRLFNKICNIIICKSKDRDGEYGA